MRTPLSSPSWFHRNPKLGPAMYEIQISNCNITKPGADAFKDWFPHKLSLPAQQVFFLRKVAFIILKTMSLLGVAQQFKIIINATYKVSGVPRLFTSPVEQTNLANVYQLPFIGTAAVAEHFTTVYNSSDSLGESFTFKTFRKCLS